MYCTKCGKEVEYSSQFCKYCGASTEEKTVERLREHEVVYTEDLSSYDMPIMIPLDMMEKYEKIIFETNPSKWAVLTIYIISAFAFLIIGLALLSDVTWAGTLFLVIGPALVLIGYLKWRSTIYGLTTNRTIVLKGIFGKDLYENRLDKIQDIRMKMSFRQRMYNYGDIFITTAGTAGVECIWKGIPNPRQKQKLLRTLLAR